MQWNNNMKKINKVIRGKGVQFYCQIIWGASPSTYDTIVLIQAELLLAEEVQRSIDYTEKNQWPCFSILCAFLLMY